MEEHCKEIDLFIEEIKSLKLKNAGIITNWKEQNVTLRKDLYKNASLELVRSLSDGIARLEKDFGYLKNPNLLPIAYEASLVEIKRRRRFRKTLDEEY